jgi:uncharacterized membrane protein YqaE (UPF0057 family)
MSQKIWYTIVLYVLSFISFLEFMVYVLLSGFSYVPGEIHICKLSLWCRSLLSIFPW